MESDVCEMDSSWEALGISLNFLEPQFPHLGKMGIKLPELL